MIGQLRLRHLALDLGGCVLALACVGVTSVQAQVDVVWDGSASSDWANPANWVSNAVPTDEIVHLSAHTSFDVGIVHYASDTPYSRRQSLLSKSLSYFGVESTYACTNAILRRILQQEIARLGAG